MGTNASKMEFNDLYWMADEDGTLLSWWVDNALAFVVSTIHSAISVVRKVRGKPRKTLQFC